MGHSETACEVLHLDDVPLHFCHAVIAFPLFGTQQPARAMVHRTIERSEEVCLAVCVVARGVQGGDGCDIEVAGPVLAPECDLENASFGGRRMRVSSIQSVSAKRESVMSSGVASTA